MYKDGIDFVVISHCKADYVNLLVKSIRKFVSEIDYDIYIVNNFVDEKNELKELNDFFSDNDDIHIVKGVDQSETTVIGNNGEFRQQSQDWVGKIDGCRVAAGSKYGEWGFEKGLKVGQREFVCALDNDAIFLDKWVDDILPLLDENLFISNRWDPGNLFREARNNKSELGMARPMFWIMKRKEMEDNELYPNNDYRDLWGNITYYAQQNDKNFKILKNSYWNPQMRNRYNISLKDIEQYHMSNDEHLLDIPYGEQAWINDRPFFFHQTRGAYRGIEALNEWKEKAGGYLEK
tara:strand:+ start:9496 stop:10371 length:876 start_codon:yes stop_codon:yes gene_type:complete